MSDIVTKAAPFSKAIVAVLAVLVLGAEAIADGAVSVDERTAIAIAVVSALGVYFKRNADAG